MTDLMRADFPREPSDVATLLQTASDRVQTLFYPLRWTPNKREAGISLIIGWSGKQYLRFDMFFDVRTGKPKWHVHLTPLPDLADVPISFSELEGSEVSLCESSLDTMTQFFRDPGLLRWLFEKAGVADQVPFLEDFDIAMMGEEIVELAA